jgi:hypothetical protein
MAVLGVSLISMPFLGSHLRGTVHLHWALTISLPLLVAALVYCLMGCSRAVGGVSITSTMMELVPKHFMGRVQNTFYFAGTLLQLVFSMTIGTVAHTRSLTEAFIMVGCIYLLAFAAGTWPVKDARAAVEEARPAVPAGT